MTENGITQQKIAYWALLGLEFDARRKARFRDGVTGEARSKTVEVKYYPRSMRYAYFTDDGVGTKGSALLALTKEAKTHGT